MSGSLQHLVAVCANRMGMVQTKGDHRGVVSDGDSVYAIAKRYGVLPKTVIESLVSQHYGKRFSWLAFSGGSNCRFSGSNN